MKKVSLVLFTVMILLIFTLCGCGKSDEEAVTGEITDPTENIHETQPTDTEKLEDKYNYKPTTFKMSTYNKDNEQQYFNISFPTDNIREVLYGHSSVTTEGLWVFCCTSFLNETIECNSIKEIYEAFNSRWEISVQDMLHDSAYSDCKFTVKNREMKEINGFTMCRYEGTLTYNHTDFYTYEVTPYSCYFAAYGTQLSEGGYVYWIVFDNSEDQSLKDIVNKNADNMAKSLEETTLF